MRGMPRVVKLRTWVSPRWNSPEPWAVGIRPTRADSGRRSRVPRPSMRTPSFTMRWRTRCLVSDRTALAISFSRPGSSADSSSSSDRVTAARAASRSDLSEMVVTLERRSVPDASTRA